MRRISRHGPPRLPLPGTSPRVLAAAPGGEELAVADRFGGLWLVPVKSTAHGREASPPRAPRLLSASVVDTPHLGPTAAYSDDGSLLVVGWVAPPMVQIWRPSEGILIRQISVQPTAAVGPRTGLVAGGLQTPLALASTGGGLLVHLRGHDVVLNDVGEGRERRVLRGHGDPIQALALSPSGRYLASADTRAFRVWDLAEEQPGALSRERVFPQPGVQWLGWVDDDELVALSPEMLQIWRRNRSQRPVYKWDLNQEGDALLWAASPPRAERSAMLVAQSAHGSLYQWDLAERTLLETLWLPALSGEQDLVLRPR